MSNLKTITKNLEKEELLLAIVVADDFDGTFSDFTHEESSVLLPVANKRVIDYALESLARCGFQEAIVFCSSHARAIKDYLKTSPWTHHSSTMCVTVMVSEKCQSLGDVLRDIDSKAVVKSDFALLSAFTVSNLNIISILNNHRQVRLKDKGAAMTLVLQDVGTRIPVLDEYTYVMNAVSNRLLMHVKCPKLSKLKIPLEHLAGNVNLNIYSNLMDTGIIICSPSVPLLFSDNFDFQTKEDFIRGLLLNEEILDSRIYCYQVENGYGSTIKNWQTFQKVNMDCMHRWTFPLVPDQSFRNEKPFSYHRHCIYKQPGVQLVNSVKLETDVIIGANTQIGHKTHILRSVIGKNCSIGKNVFIRDSYLFDNCVIGDNTKIELCVLGESSKIQNHSRLKKCVLKRNVTLNAESHQDSVLIANKSQGKTWKKINEHAYCVKVNTNMFGSKENLNEQYLFGLVDPEVEFEETYEDEDITSDDDDDDDKSYMQSPEADDVTVFYSEVVDSLHRGFEEKLSCENLILEINSSRYAYNVMLSDVTIFTLKGILLLPGRVGSTTKAVLAYFLPLLKNYVKTPEAQMNCLDLIETQKCGYLTKEVLYKNLVDSNAELIILMLFCYFTSPTLTSYNLKEIYHEFENELAKCLHFLYDNDIISEESILEWHDNLEKDSPIVKKIAPLIKWLNEAAEESSSEESE